jgi:hypothetical protein
MRGHSVLERKILDGNPSVVEFLLMHGAKPTEQDLHVAKTQAGLGIMTPTRQAMFRNRNEQEKENRKTILMLIQNAIQK